MSGETFTLNEVVVATRRSRPKVLATIKRLGITPAKSERGHYRFSRDQAKEIVEAIDAEKADPRLRIMGTD